MNIKLIYISKNKSNNIELLVEDYEKKINHFISYSSIGLKNKNQKTEKKLIQKSESVLILKNIKSNDLVILLDEKGKEFSTLDFSKFISNKMMNRTKNIVFIIGGAYGFSMEFKEKFELKIALSKFTFSHDLARLFLNRMTNLIFLFLFMVFCDSYKFINIFNLSSHFSLLTCFLLLTFFNLGFGANFKSFFSFIFLLENNEFTLIWSFK